MTRGGKRTGAGRPAKWKSSITETKVIRLPVHLADAIQTAQVDGLSADILTKAIEKVIQNKKKQRVTA
mgnify:CR=1